MSNICDNKHIGRELKEISNLFARFAESKANKEGVTFVQGRFLHYIKIRSKSSKVYQKDIEREFSIRPSSATELLQKLERYGLIARVEDEIDKRSKLIKITEKGMELETKIFGQLCQFERELREGIGEKEIETFFMVISKLKENLSERMEGDL